MSETPQVPIGPENTPQAQAVKSDLTAWRQSVDRFGTEPVAGSNMFPDWYTNQMAYGYKDSVRDIVAGNVEFSWAVSEYFQLRVADRVANARLSGKEAGPICEVLTFVTNDLGADVVGAAIREEGFDGPLHSALLDLLNQNFDNKHGTIDEQLTLVQKAYGLGSATELLGLGGDEFADKVQSYVRTEKGINWIASQDREFVNGRPHAENLRARYEWVKKAVGVVSGMPSEEALNYSYTASRHSEVENMVKIIEVFNHFGAERIRNITSATGITSLECYSIEQLERMERYAIDPEGVAGSLKEHDVTAVLVNRFGDHNGVMSGTAKEVDDGERVLFFEISRIDDIYRQLSRLSSNGINPSTLIVAAHGGGEGGKIFISDERDTDEKRHDIAAVGARRLISAYNDSTEAKDGNIRAYSMHGMRGLSRVVGNYMHPSKGVDDPDKGRKKIVFTSCSSAREVEVKDIDEHGENITIGMESVISQLAKDLAQSGVSEVDVFGAPDGTQSHWTEKGIRYSGQEQHGINGRSELRAVKISINAGSVTNLTLPEVILRK